MFLSQFEGEKKLKQALFFEYAMLVTMAEGKMITPKEFESKTDSSSEETINTLNPYWVFSPENNKTTLEQKIAQYLIATGVNSNERKLLHSYLGEMANEDLAKHLDVEYLFYSRHFRYVGSRSQSYVPAIYGANDEYMTVVGVITKCALEIIEQFSKDESIKKKLIEIILEDGGDLSDIQGDKMQLTMATFPQVKAEILKTSAKLLFENKKDEINLSEREKKIILFELIGAGFSSGQFETEEIHLIEYICELLDIDKEYIEEFTDVASKLFEANRDILELINE